ncbi:MAG: pseudouridine synthase [Desulfovibrio sp.]|nr:pseudouridine synthase [Desulfovibrio sp.]
MQLDFIPRNNDLGACVPTFQERVNGMLPAEHPITLTESSEVAQEISLPRTPLSPHYLSSSEVDEALCMMEEEAQKQNMELLRIHSGLNRDRIMRLLDLLH